MARWCATIGELQAALADLPDDAPLIVTYDGGSGSANHIGVEGIASEPCGWVDAGQAVLTIG
jgi:hypothetical protein